MEKLKMHSVDKVQEHIKKISEIFPNTLTEIIKGYHKDGSPIIEHAIDFDILRQELSDVLVEGPEERYQFTWPDKKKSILLSNAPITKTLRPYREESLNFDGTENLYIEGDNLEVLKLIQETYLGKIKIIYIDPPYNTGKDFIYNDNFKLNAEEYILNSGQFDEDGNRLVQNTERNGRFHTDWLNMIYSRLKISKDLLSNDGVIFISVDDTEMANLKKICDEIFGNECFVCSAIWRSSDNSNNDAKQFSNDHNYTLIYSKQPMWQPKKQFNESKRKHFKNPDNDPKGPYFDGNPLNSPNYRENLIYDIVSPQGKTIKPPKNGWRWSKETLQKKIKTGEIRFTEDGTGIRRRTYLLDMKGLPPSSLWIDLEETGHNRQAKYELLKLLPENVFDTPKPVRLIKYIINLVEENKDAIILDFFSGSGTTADAVMQLNSEDNGNRKFILIQLPEDLDESYKYASNDKKTIISNAIKLCDELGAEHKLSEIAKERIRRAGNKILVSHPELSGKIDIGFRVLKVDSSNMQDIYYRPDEYSQDMLATLEDNIKQDRTSEDLLFQVLLELGVLLSSKIEKLIIDGKKVFNVADGYLIACFDKNITSQTVSEIAKRQPYYAVFRDSSLSDDSVATNFDQIFETYSPTTIRKVL